MCKKYIYIKVLDLERKAARPSAGADVAGAKA